MPKTKPSVELGAKLEAPEAKRARITPSAGAPRVRHSCVACRKSKVKCTGVVPCTRCVRLGKEAECTLWHRPTGRPKSSYAQITPAEAAARLAAASQGCPHRSDIMRTLAKRFHDKGLPIPQFLIWYSRLLVMMGLRERNIKAMHAGTMLAVDGMMELDGVMLASLAEDGMADVNSVFEAVQSDPWKSCDNMQVGTIASEWIKQIKMKAPPEARAAVEWANEIISGGDQHSSDEYQIATAIKGALRLANIKTLLNKNMNDHTDEEVIKTAQQTGQLAEKLTESGVKVDFYMTRMSSSEEASKARKQAYKLGPAQLDLPEYRAQYAEQLEKALLQMQQEGKDTKDGVAMIQTIVPVKCMDAQGRIWVGISEERSVLCVHGAFNHRTRLRSNFKPGCERAQKMVEHMKIIRQRRRDQAGGETDVLEQGIQQSEPEQQLQHVVTSVVNSTGYISVSSSASEDEEVAITAMRNELECHYDDIGFDFDELMSGGL